jgi:hypothetical protein
MRFDSRYFDRVRVKPGEDSLLRDRLPGCEWPGCTKLGRHRAPKGRDREGQYFAFCLEHVQQYNKSYNYFQGMDDEALANWHKDAATGHRPTWKLGENSWAAHNASRSGRSSTGPRDPHGLFSGRGDAQPPSAKRPVRNAELKALHTLGLDETATAEEVKAKYKTLVKRLHPDANGGSRANEDTLKAVIQSYDYLRSTGYC